MMKVAFVINCLALVTFGLSLVYADRDCRPETFQVQPNFDDEKFQGKWYEVRWIIEPWIPLKFNFFDFAKNFTKTEYGFSLFWWGRWPKNGTTCSTSNFSKLFRTSENAKHVRQARSNRTVIYNSTYWIVDTDYDNYALVYGCRETSLNGTCVDPIGFMWTRCPNPGQEHITRMEQGLPKLCLKPQQFITTYQYQDCSETPAECSSWNRTESSSGNRIEKREEVFVAVLLVPFIGLVFK